MPQQILAGSVDKTFLEALFTFTDDIRSCALFLGT